MKHKTNGSRSVALAVLIGGITMLLITIIGAVITASAVNGGTLSQKGFKITASVIWLISSFGGCVVSSKMAGRSVWVVCSLGVLAYIALLAAIQILFFDSGFSEIVMPLAISVAGMLPVILWNRRNAGGKRSKKHYRFH